METDSLYYPLERLRRQHLETKYLNFESFSSDYERNFGKVCMRYPQWEQKLIQLLLDNKYSDAVMLINTDKAISALPFHARNKFLLRTHLLNCDYKVVLDFEARLAGNFPDSNIMDQNDFVECKLLTILNWYLRGEFHQCLQRFIQLVTEIPELFDILEKWPTRDAFITATTFYYIVTLTALVSIPLDNLDTFIHLSELERFNKTFNIFAGKGKLLVESRFGQFFQWWHTDMDKICKSNYFLEKKWDIVAKTMRQKIYAFYLRISMKINVSYLSEKFGIDYQVVNQEISHLITEACLNFRIDGDLITYLEFDSTSALTEMIDKENLSIDDRISQLRNRNNSIRCMIGKLVKKKQKSRSKCPSKDSLMNEEEVYALSDEQYDETNDSAN